MEPVTLSAYILVATLVGTITYSYATEEPKVEPKQEVVIQPTTININKYQKIKE